jgi:hypothetical protein
MLWSLLSHSLILFLPLLSIAFDCRLSQFYLSNSPGTLELESVLLNSNSSQSQNQTYFTTSDIPPISSSWLQAPWASRAVFFSQLNPCGHSPYVTSSLTRGWICRLQLLLALASADILRSDSRGTHGHILRPQIRDSLNLKGQVSVFISPRNIAA